MPDLYPFQATGAEFLAERANAMIADEMGLGKTPQAIAAADAAMCQSVLVLCPAIARTNWSREFAAWQRFNRSIAVVDHGRARTDADVVICSDTLAASLWTRLQKRGRRFDVLVWDEAHRGKSADAQRTKAVYGGRCERKTGLASLADRLWLLTGTPMPNSLPSELWTHLRAMDAVRMSYWQFVDEWCAVRVTPFKREIVGLRPSKRAEFAAMCRPFVLRRKQEDVLRDLPPIRYTHVTVKPDTLPPAPPETPEIATILTTALARLDKGEKLTVDEQMHLATLRRWTGTAKVPAIVELIREHFASAQGPLGVFAIHKAVIAGIAEAFPDCGVIDGGTSAARRQNVVDRFQAGDLRLLVMQFTAASTALTLTAASNALMAEMPWTPGDVAQAAKRFHRIGQNKSVLVRAVSLAGSVDERINAAVLRKVKEMAATDAVLVDKPVNSLPPSVTAA